ncbi:protein kinase domain-containing protein [Streptomyces sp. BI20]|uniref:protein kinase domain-containing protein n=1 Tax=Streptomyces sp. BI20 TaxID=3403460 RepID=UPI003C7282B5
MSQDGGHGTQGRYAGGSLAGGRYRLNDLLGEGGMASVYLGHDTALDRPVAVKTLHSELGREQSFRERFRREAQAVAKLSHTNVVSVFDTGEGELGGEVMPYIVMEYVEGDPLGSVLRADIERHGAMPADRALQVTADVLAALDASHEMGLVHRDIKPGNVMVTRRGTIKVMDFGIARAMQSGVTSMTQTGMVVGTPQYLSPEQALGRGVDARSDLYSVGIMLFQLLTGRLPFDADSPLAIAYAHVQEEPVAPSTVNRSVTPAMDALVLRALKKNPNERFPTAEAMRGECLRVLASLGGHGAAPSIVAGGPPANSGAGVGSTVFPPLDASAATPGAYAPTPAPSPYAPTPAPTASPYQAPGQTGGYAYPPAAQSTSPFPAASPGAPGGPGRKRNTPVLIGAAVAVLAIGGLVTALVMNGKDGSKDPDPSASSSAPVAVAGHKGPNLGATVDKKICSEARTSYSDPQQVDVPDFRFKNINSVRECLQAAGWQLNTQVRDENVYGEGTVMEQLPAPGSTTPKKGSTFTLTVSTGNPVG